MKAIGHSIDGADDHWVVNCPGCGKEYEYQGFFDPEDITKCDCGVSFKIIRVEFENGDYIK